MRTDSQMTDEMLVKFLLDESSAAEQAAVQHWVAASEANKKHFYHFKLLWDESRALAATTTVDENAAWQRFRQRTAAVPQRRVIPFTSRFFKVAAALLVLAGGAWLAYTLADNKTQTQVAAEVKTAPVNKQTILPAPANSDVAAQTAPNDALATATQEAMPAMPKTRFINLKSKPKFIASTHDDPLYKNTRTKEFICNATPCPLEICIIQKIRCQDGSPSAISTCSVLEPDESGQLHYKGFDKITRDCRATIEEIRIKRMTTGETIVLNADSKPSTAEDFFNYINGQKKGDIIAGMFHTDCDNRKDDCGLTFDNNFGHLILQ